METTYADFCQMIGHLYITFQKSLKDHDNEKNNLINSVKEQLDSKNLLISKLQKEVEELKSTKT